MKLLQYRAYAFFIMLCVACVIPGKVFAATYYVATVGNDTNSGASDSAPWKTIQKAANTAKAGDTVYVHGGTYKEQVTFSSSGTSAGRITFLASPNESPVIDGSAMTSIATDGLVQIWEGKDYITLSGFTIKGSPRMGLANRGSNNIFSNNKIVSSFDTAIWHRFGTNTVFRNNEIYFNVRKIATSASDTGIVCDGNAGWWPAATNSQNSTGVLWEANYIHNNCGEGIVAHTGDKVIGNTFKDNWSVNIYIDDGTGILLDKNYISDTDTVFSAWPGNGRNIPIGIAIADETLPCGTSNNTISNNVVVNTRFGLSFYPYQACSGIIATNIINNTFINSWEYGIRVNGSAAVHSGSSIANNIVYSNRGKALIIENPADFKIYKNLWYYAGGGSTGQFQWGNTAYDFAKWSALSSQMSGNLWADPQFAGSVPSDPSKLNPGIFALKDSSPAVNSGLSGDIYPKFDFNGISRPQANTYDIGAFEYTGTQNVAQASTGIPTPVPTPILSLTCPSSGSVAGGTATTTINVTTTGNYKAWVQMKGTGNTGNSVYLKLDNLYCAKVGDLAGMPSGVWTWVDYQNGSTSDKIPMPILASGDHTITLIGNGSEPGVAVDRLLLTRDSACVPAGNGDACLGIVSTPTPTLAPSAIPVPAPVETISPSVSLNVSDGYKLPSRGSFKLTGYAKDSSGISKIQLLVDGKNVVTCNNATACSYTWRVGPLSIGQHRVTVIAYDKAQSTNSGSRSVLVKR